jgi:hypothetical protein
MKINKGDDVSDFGFISFSRLKNVQSVKYKIAFDD